MYRQEKVLGALKHQSDLSPRPTYDVIVAGGGPAGAVASLYLARLGWNVALLEASTSHSTAIGETLPPECTPLFRELDLWDAFQRSRPIQSPGIVSTWGATYPSGQDFLRNAHGTGWHLDRARFDAELRAEAAHAGVAVIYGARVQTALRCDGYWHANALRAPYLIDATGRNGLRLEGAATREIDDLLLVLVLRISHPGRRPPDLRTQIAATPAGWWYWTPIPNGDSIAMFFTCREEYVHIQLRNPAAWARTQPAVAHLFAPAQLLDSRWLYASSSLRKQLSGDAWIATGDSASSYDPLSGRGIFKAIRHASLAAQALHALRNGRPDLLVQYEARVRAEYHAYVAQRRAYYAQEQRFPGTPFWTDPRRKSL